MLRAREQGARLLHRQLMPRLDRAIERPHDQVRKGVDQALAFAHPE
jgi:hypothetical protein